MGKTKEQIINGLRALSNKDNEVFSGVVKSVDEQAGTMDVMPDPDDADFVLPVMLRSSVEDLKGIVIIPKVGTEVVFVTIDGGGQFTIVNASELSGIKVDVPELKIKCDSVVVNDGKNGELPIESKILENLNELKKYAEALKSAVSAGLDAVGVGSSASGTAGKTAFEAAMLTSKINIKKMGNNKVKH